MSIVVRILIVIMLFIAVDAFGFTYADSPCKEYYAIITQTDNRYIHDKVLVNSEGIIEVVPFYPNYILTSTKPRFLIQNAMAWYWTGSFWRTSSQSGGFVVFDIGPFENVSNPSIPPTGTCPSDCSEQKAQLIQQCSGEINVDWTSWSDETCEGGQCREILHEYNLGAPGKC